MKFFGALLPVACTAMSFQDDYFSIDFSTDFSMDFSLDFSLDFSMGFSMDYDYESFPYDDMIWSSYTDTETDSPVSPTLPRSEYTNTDFPEMGYYTFSPTPSGYADTSFPSSSPSSSPSSGYEEFTFSPTQMHTSSPTSEKTGDFDTNSLLNSLSSTGDYMKPMYYVALPIIVVLAQLVTL